MLYVWTAKYLSVTIKFTKNILHFKVKLIDWNSVHEYLFALKYTTQPHFYSILTKSLCQRLLFKFHFYHTFRETCLERITFYDKTSVWCNWPYTISLWLKFRYSFNKISVISHQLWHKFFQTRFITFGDCSLVDECEARDRMTLAHAQRQSCLT